MGPDIHHLLFHGNVPPHALLADQRVIVRLRAQEGVHRAHHMVDDHGKKDVLRGFVVAVRSRHHVREFDLVRRIPVREGIDHPVFSARRIDDGNQISKRIGFVFYESEAGRILFRFPSLGGDPFDGRLAVVPSLDIGFRLDAGVEFLRFRFA